MTDSNSSDSIIEPLHDGVVRRHSHDGKISYIKRASDTEIERTRNFVEKWGKRFPDAIFQPPEVISYNTPSQVHVEEAMGTVYFIDRIHRLETVAHPDLARIYELDPQILMKSLAEQKITQPEISQILTEHLRMARMGLAHGDLMANAIIGRNQEGQLKIYLFDFDPLTKNPADSDLRTLLTVINDWIRMGIVDSRRVERQIGPRTL